MGIKWFKKDIEADEYTDSIKSEINYKGGRTEMAKKEIEEDDFDSDIEDISEEEEEEKPLPKAQPKPKPMPQKQNPNRFAAVHQEALEAVLDNETNKAQANIFEILTDILNRLEEIKRAVGS